MLFYQDPVTNLYNADCRNMSELKDESVHMCVTSPPYWGLRSYKGLPDMVWGNQDCQLSTKRLAKETAPMRL